MLTWMHAAVILTGGLVCSGDATQLALALSEYRRLAHGDQFLQDSGARFSFGRIMPAGLIVATFLAISVAIDTPVAWFVTVGVSLGLAILVGISFVVL